MRKLLRIAMESRQSTSTPAHSSSDTTRGRLLETVSHVLFDYSCCTDSHAPRSGVVFRNWSFLCLCRFFTKKHQKMWKFFLFVGTELKRNGATYFCQHWNFLKWNFRHHYNTGNSILKSMAFCFTSNFILFRRCWRSTGPFGTALRRSFECGRWAGRKI